MSQHNVELLATHFVYAYAMKESVYERMMRWGRERGWNQTEIANRLGVPSSQNVGNWRLRGVPPDKHLLIARTFGRSVDELLGLVREDDVPRSYDPLSDEEKALLDAFRSLGPTERGYLLEDAKKYQSKKK